MITLYLLMHDGVNGDRVVAVTEEASIGRDLAADVVIDDEEASRIHAMLRPARGGWTLADADSTNGTFVNGSRLVGACAVHPGDVLQIGRVTMEVHARAPQLG